MDFLLTAGLLSCCVRPEGPEAGRLDNCLLCSECQVLITTSLATLRPLQTLSKFMLLKECKGQMDSVIMPNPIQLAWHLSCHALRTGGQKLSSITTMYM